MMWYLKNALVLVIILLIVTALWAFLINKEERKTIPKLGGFWLGTGLVTWTILYFTGIASTIG